jgi:hypothetical protein
LSTRGCCFPAEASLTSAITLVIRSDRLAPGSPRFLRMAAVKTSFLPMPSWAVLPGWVA